MFSRVCKEIYVYFYFETSFFVPLTVNFCASNCRMMNTFHHTIRSIGFVSYVLYMMMAFIESGHETISVHTSSY